MWAEAEQAVSLADSVTKRAQSELGLGSSPRANQASVNANDGSLIGTALHAYAVLRGNELLKIHDDFEDARSLADGCQMKTKGG